jgi:hypothetical protein
MKAGDVTHVVMAPPEKYKSLTSFKLFLFFLNDSKTIYQNHLIDH